MVAKILGSLKACKMLSPGSFALQDYTYRKLNLCSLLENFPQYPPDITIQNIIIIYFILQLFSWFKN